MCTYSFTYKHSNFGHCEPMQHQCFPINTWKKSKFPHFYPLLDRWLSTHCYSVNIEINGMKYEWAAICYRAPGGTISPLTHFKITLIQIELHSFIWLMHFWLSQTSNWIDFWFAQIRLPNFHSYWFKSIMKKSVFFAVGNHLISVKVPLVACSLRWTFIPKSHSLYVITW